LCFLSVHVHLFLINTTPTKKKKKKKKKKAVQRQTLRLHLRRNQDALRLRATERICSCELSSRNAKIKLYELAFRLQSATSYRIFFFWGFFSYRICCKGFDCRVDHGVLDPLIVCLKILNHTHVSPLHPNTFFQLFHLLGELDIM